MIVLASITLLEFAAANPILAVILAFFAMIAIIGVFQSLSNMVAGTLPKPPFEGDNKNHDEE